MPESTPVVHRSTRRFWAAWVVVMLLVFVLPILLAGPWSFSPMHHANVRELNHNAVKVERYCGKKRADAFREVIDPDHNSEIPMREWVKRCLTEGDR